jgi:hypothetical protein
VRGICRTRGVHERAGLSLKFLARVRTDTMVGHVDWVDLLHLNMEQKKETCIGSNA